MDFTITRGVQKKAQKVVIYGPEGIGKSTFAAQFPDPLFIDTEGSTKHMDVARLPRPTSWAMLGEELGHVKQKHPCQTLVIDTIDWAELLCVEAVCAKHGKSGIEDFGYGNGYVYTKEEFGRFLNRLEDIIEQDIHVVLCAHAQIRKFEQPDEMGAYDRYELKLGKKTQSQTAPLVKEWADMLLFANYKTVSVAVDEKGKKHKAQGGRRILYTTHHPCWDAKNRHDLPEELPFDYGQIARCVPDLGSARQGSDIKPENAPEPPPAIVTPQQAQVPEEQPRDPEVPEPTETKPEEPVLDKRQAALQKLFDIMDLHTVDRKMLQWAVGHQGYYTQDTPIEHYTTDFIEWLPTVWDGVDQLIKEQLEKNIPF